jgi:hypothetical protein
MTDQKILANAPSGTRTSSSRINDFYRHIFKDGFKDRVFQENGISRQYYTRLVCHIMRDCIGLKKCLQYHARPKKNMEHEISDKFISVYRCMMDRSVIIRAYNSVMITGTGRNGDRGDVETG